MTIWLDERISPTVAFWIEQQFATSATAVRDLGLARASDLAVFRAAREANAILITKDQDFVRLVGRHGPPPSVITSLAAALSLIQAGEALVEISDAR